MTDPKDTERPGRSAGAKTGSGDQTTAAWTPPTEPLGEPPVAGLVRGHLLADRADPGISQLAESLRADLIVMGTRCSSRLRHPLLGSVTERTVRHAPCSVLTVKDSIAAH